MLVDYENLFFFFSFLILKFSVNINEKGLFSQSMRAGYVNGSYMRTLNIFVHEGGSLYLDSQS